MAGKPYELDPKKIEMATEFLNDINNLLEHQDILRISFFSQIKKYIDRDEKALRKVKLDFFDKWVKALGISKKTFNERIILGENLSAKKRKTSSKTIL